MINLDKTWLKTNEDKLKSLIADEAKLKPIYAILSNTISQLQAKNTFRLALLNQVLSDIRNQKKSIE